MNLMNSRTGHPPAPAVLTDEVKGESSKSDHQVEDECKHKWSFSLGGDPEQGLEQVQG